jgi:CheY-like chemotaxis protein
MNQQRVLVLDDHEAILEVVTEALRYEQLEVLGIREGRKLLAAVADFRPDLILLDYRLADVNGGDLCRQLKSMEAYSHIPVIVFSAYFSPGETIPADCDGYLYKPFNLAELFKAVRELLPTGSEVSNGR